MYATLTFRCINQGKGGGTGEQGNKGEQGGNRKTGVQPWKRGTRGDKGRTNVDDDNDIDDHVDHDDDEDDDEEEEYHDDDDDDHNHDDVDESKAIPRINLPHPGV